MAKVKSDLEVLAPTPVVWTIGDQEFTQSPLPLSRLGEVLQIVVDELLKTGNIDMLFDTLGQQAEALTDGKEVKAPATGDTIRLALSLAAGVPKALPRVVATILEADEDYMREHLGARTAIAVVRTFVQQNDVGALVNDFFGIVQEIQGTPTETTNNQKP